MSEAAASSSAAAANAEAPAAPVKIKSSDGHILEVPRAVIGWWKTIDTMIRDLGGEDENAAADDSEAIPVDKCSKETLDLVTKWCSHYVGTRGPFPPIDDEFADLNFDDSDIDDDDDPQMKEIKFLQEMKIPEWDKEFLRFGGAADAIDKLLNVIEAANFLDIEDLLNITCKTVANIMAGKTPEQIREIFNIECDYTPEELEKLKKEIAWCEGIEAN